MTNEQIKEIVTKLSLEEKAGLCSGHDFWRTKPIEHADIPSVMLTDGPHGLRKQSDDADHLGLFASVTAVCFPAACATACSFDRELLRSLGETLGDECQSENVSILLGPAMNIKRSPLCGRNFEYISEDPYLCGELAASYISGVQSRHIGTSVKHFAANNQEYERMAGSSEMDERTLREIYLSGFEKAVKAAQPKTVMCSYNRINGVYASENKKLMSDILRDEWGFEGYVMTDWGAIADRVKGLEAGIDLEMPSSGGINDREIVKAVQSGALEESVLDRSVERILRVTFDYIENRQSKAFDREADHAKAVALAKQCVVLLKNDGILPLAENSGETIAFIGGFAVKPRYQGGGSSHINAYKVDSTLEAALSYGKIEYAEGFSTAKDELDATLLEQAVALAKSADKAVIFAGLPDIFESEGYDRTHMRLPDCQNKLIEEVLKVQKKVIIVLHNGSPVEMPWVNDVSAIVEAYLGGEGIAVALADILFGRTNPCGKLAETFPLRLQDNPSYLSFPGKDQKVYYNEGVFVGYRYYDSREMDVLFPFGFGLSYTTFAMSDLRLDKQEVSESDSLIVSVCVTNTGDREGKEVVQLYVADLTDTAIRPSKELRGFEAVTLKPGESKTVTIELDKRAFAWYNESIHDWYAATGSYAVMVGNSSRNIALTAPVTYKSETELPFVVDANTMIGELLRHPKAHKFVKDNILSKMFGMMHADDPEWAAMQESFAKYTPLRAMRSFAGLSNDAVAEMVSAINNLL